MSTAVPMPDDTFSWPAWANGEEAYGYSPTNAGGVATTNETRPGWFAFAMMATLTTAAGVTPAVALESLAGTGGSIDNLVNEDQTDALPGTSWEVFFEQVGEHTNADAMEAPEAAELIAEIKATLGVSVTDLATIAGVSRQAVYDWIGGGQVSEANYDRLLELRQICSDWRKRTSRPIGRFLRAKDNAGGTLLDLLRRDSLHKEQIELHMDALAGMAEKQGERRKERKSKLSPLSEQDRYENALTHVIPATHS